MTICSWRTQSPERPLNFVRAHAKLRNSKPRCTTTSVLRNRHSAPCQGLKFERSIFRNDVFSIDRIHQSHASLSWAVLRADDSLFRDYGWSVDVRAARDRSWQFLVPPNILVDLSQLHKKGTFYLPPRNLAPPNSAESDGRKLDGPKLETPEPTQAPPPPNSIPMKISFAATALALAASACTGLIMSWKYARRKSIVPFTLTAGVVIPATLSFV
jgi:hypothetical protein